MPKASSPAPTTTSSPGACRSRGRKPAGSGPSRGRRGRVGRERMRRRTALACACSGWPAAPRRSAPPYIRGMTVAAASRTGRVRHDVLGAGLRQSLVGVGTGLPRPVHNARHVRRTLVLAEHGRRAPFGRDKASPTQAATGQLRPRGGCRREEGVVADLASTSMSMRRL